MFVDTLGSNQLVCITFGIGCRLVGKVAVDNSHKWVFRDAPNQGDNPNFISSWNVSTEPVSNALLVEYNVIFILQ